MESAKTRGVGFCLAMLLPVFTSREAHAQATGFGPVMVRVQLEPGALLARQNGPLTMGLNSFGLTGSLAIGINVSSSTAVGVEGWVGLAAAPRMTITAPDFDGAGDTVQVNEPSLMALLIGPHITHVFQKEGVSVSATAGITQGTFGSKGYALYKPDPDYTGDTDCSVEPYEHCLPTLPYNRSKVGDEPGYTTEIPVDDTLPGWGFGVALSKLWPIADAMHFGIGVQFRYLVVPDGAVYYDDDDRGPLRYRADSWSITSFGMNASLTYF